MNKIAAYEMLLESHPLWTKEAMGRHEAEAYQVMGILGGLGAAGGALSAGEGERLRGAGYGALAAYPASALALLQHGYISPKMLAAAPAGGALAGLLARRRGKDKSLNPRQQALKDRLSAKFRNR